LQPELALFGLYEFFLMWLMGTSAVAESLSPIWPPPASLPGRRAEEEVIPAALLERRFAAAYY
jgi:hypothetical protein